MDLLKQFRELWEPLGANQKVSLFMAAGLVVVAMVALMLWAAQPEMKLLYGGLSDEDLGEITYKLEQEGIGYEIGRTGDSVYVDAADQHTVRAKLAKDGLVPSGTGPGFELFDEGSFGISDFVQRTNFLRAVQGELSRTIMQFDGISAARVMVVMPENRIVVSKTGQDRPTASVFVDTSGGIGLSAVNSIRHLVANAIQGLDVNDVVVVDSAGVVLSEELRSDGISGGMASDIIRYRKGLEVYFTNKVQTMLDRVLGPHQSEVRVAVDVDTSSVQTTEKSFDPDSQVALSYTTEKRDLRVLETGGDVGGVAGVTGNLPDAPESSGPLKDIEDSTTTQKNEYAVSEIVSSRVQNPGTIKRLTASLLVSTRLGEEGAPFVRSEEELQRLRQIVITALGIELKPGQRSEDLVTVTEMAFAADPLASQGELVKQDADFQKWLELGKSAGGMVFGIFVIIFFLRMLKRNHPEKISLEVLRPEEMLQSRRMENTTAVTPEMLNELIQQKPTNIGMTLKDWIGDPETASK